MHKIHEIKEMALEELGRFADRGELRRDDLPTIDYLAHIAKDLCWIINDCEERTGYSYGTRVNMRGTYSGDYRRPYYDDHSYARMRDSRGRYSGADDAYLIETLHELKEKAPNDAMRMEFQEFIDRMERMKK